MVQQLRALALLGSFFQVVAYTSTTSQPFAISSTPTLPRPKTKTSSGLDLKLPDFNCLFEKIQQISPLAQSVIARSNGKVTKDDPALKWKTVEESSSAASSVQNIQKLRQFAGIPTPVFRFRTRLGGTTISDFFGRFVSGLRKSIQLDPNMDTANEIHSVADLGAVNSALPRSRYYGTCTRLGVGYARSKPALGVSSRELMFLYGLQEFPDGSFLLWGTEMGEEDDHMLPTGQRHTRAKTHLFSVAFKPTGKESFAIEYVMQFEVGGRIPSWMAGPLLVESVKGMFDMAQDECANAASTKVPPINKRPQAPSDNSWHHLLVPV